MIIDIVLIAVGPILVAVLLFFAIRRKKMYFTKKGWIRFPLGLILSAAAPVGLSILINLANPYVSVLNWSSFRRLIISLDCILGTVYGSSDAVISSIRPPLPTPPLPSSLSAHSETEKHCSSAVIRPILGASNRQHRPRCGS